MNLKCAVVLCSRDAYTIEYGAALCEECRDNAMEFPWEWNWHQIEHLLGTLIDEGRDVADEDYPAFYRKTIDTAKFPPPRQKEIALESAQSGGS